MTPAQIKLLITFCVLFAIVVLSGGIGYSLGNKSGRIALADYQKAAAEQTAKDADKLAKLTQEYRETEQAHAAQLNDVATQYEADKRAIETNAERLVSDLRSDNRRLHKRWQVAQAAASVSGTQPSPGQPDAAERERQDSAARIIAAADQCDAQVAGLQEVIRADRK